MPIQSIKRASDILSLFSIDNPRWGVTEIANALGLSKTTTSSLVRTLRDVGYLEQDTETRRYRLGHKVFILGIIMEETLEINQKASRFANHLAEETGLITRVAIWDGNAALITLDVTPRNIETLPRRIGPRIVAYCTSLGRAFLAHMEPADLGTYLKETELRPLTHYTETQKERLIKELNATKARGYALNNQEVAIGRASIAAPVFQRGGLLAAAISITGRPDRILGEDLDQLACSLQNAATEISRQMGFNKESPDGVTAGRISM